MADDTPWWMSVLLRWRVGDYYVFDIGGNKFRIIAAVHFNRQLLFVRHVFTHKEYDRWSPK